MNLGFFLLAAKRLIHNFITSLRMFFSVSAVCLRNWCRDVVSPRILAFN